MNEIVVMRGLPASGKSTWARAWYWNAPETRARVCRDDIRAHAFDAIDERYATYFADPSLREKEEIVSKLEDRTVKSLLDSGKSVVIDATHIRRSYITKWADLAARTGSAFTVKLIDTPVDICIGRDQARPFPVGEKVIRDMHRRLQSAIREPVPVPKREATVVQLYEPDDTLPVAWLVDIDGTLALMNGRSPYDTTRYHEDKLNDVVADLVSILADAGVEIVVMSGRDERYRNETLNWLVKHNIPGDALFMRPAEDTRNDAIVKLELFFEHVAPKWHVVGALDDRDRVVEAWRSIGLTCLQVAPGDF